MVASSSPVRGSSRLTVKSLMSATQIEPAAPSVAHGLLPVGIRLTTYRGRVEPLALGEGEPVGTAAVAGLPLAEATGAVVSAPVEGPPLEPQPATSNVAATTAGSEPRRPVLPIPAHRRAGRSQRYYDFVVVTVT